MVEVRGYGYLILVCLLGLASSGCDTPQPPPPGENVLTLTLGGGRPSLRATLQLGRRTTRKPRPLDPTIDPTINPTINPTIDPVVTPRPDDSKPDVPIDPRPTPTPEPTPRRRPEPAREFRVVRLRDGQTLYSLCKEHLGSGPRWKEVAALNGWTEHQAGHLRSGCAVKLPLR